MLMLVSIRVLLELCNLIKKGSVEIQMGDTLIKVGQNTIEVDLSDAAGSSFFDREDILTQLKALSQTCSEAGKTIVVKYRHSRVVSLGAGAHSVVLGMLGMDHIRVGNPITMYLALRKWRKNSESRLE